MFCVDENHAFALRDVFYVARSSYESENTGRRHSALAYRIRGDCRYTCHGRRLEAKNASVTYIPAGVDYTQQCGEEEMIVLHLRAFGQEPDCIQVLQLSARGHVESLFRRLHRLWEEKGADHRFRCAAMLYSILAEVENSKQEIKEPQIIAPGAAYIRRHFRDAGFTVGKAAAACSISEVYFRRLYKAAYGMTPLEAVNGLRFAHAAKLLASGYYTAEETAELSGFSDVKYFRTAFRRHFGMTPGEYCRHV